MIIVIILILIGSFLLGSVPFGQLVARHLSGVDLRSTGSGNVGATNVARTLGMKLGLLTLVLDLLKGLIPVLCAGLSAEAAGWNAAWVSSGAGLAAFLGHVYSPLLGFKGGKGVATALGVFLALTPLAVVPALLLFIVVVARSGYVSLGSMSAAVFAPIVAIILGYPRPAWLLSLVMAAIIIWRHRANIGRLIKGEENHWRGKKKTAEPSA